MPVRQRPRVIARVWRCLPQANSLDSSHFSRVAHAVKLARNALLLVIPCNVIADPNPHLVLVCRLLYLQPHALNLRDRDSGAALEVSLACCGRQQYPKKHEWQENASHVQREVSGGSRPPQTFDLSLGDSAGSHSLHRLVGSCGGQQSRGARLCIPTSQSDLEHPHQLDRCPIK